MQFSVTTLIASCTWVAVIFASTNAVLRMPNNFSDLPSVLVGMLSCSITALAMIALFTKEKMNRTFWLGYTIASFWCLGFMLFHEPDGPNNQTTLRSIVDGIFAIANVSHDSWHLYHLANVFEYWLVPVCGMLGGNFASLISGVNSAETDAQA